MSVLISRGFRRKNWEEWQSSKGQDEGKVSIHPGMNVEHIVLDLSNSLLP